MNETIRLMKSHFSVRRFKEEAIKEADLKEILSAGQMASSWKNFQSYSVIVVKSKEKKEALYDLLPQEAIRQSDVFLLFVGDLNRAEKAVKLHEQDFHPEGVDNLLITSVDAVCCATVQRKLQNSSVCQTIPTLFLGLLSEYLINSMR